MERAQTGTKTNPPLRLIIPVPLQIRRTLRRYNQHSKHYSFQDHVLIYLDLMNELSFESQFLAYQIHLDKTNQKTPNITYPFY